MPGTNNEPWDGEVEILGGPRGPRPAILITAEDVRELVAGEVKEHRRQGQLNSERETRTVRCLRPGH